MRAERPHAYYLYVLQSHFRCDCEFEEFDENVYHIINWRRNLKMLAPDTYLYSGSSTKAEIFFLCPPTTTMRATLLVLCRVLVAWDWYISLGERSRSPTNVRVRTALPLSPCLVQSRSSLVESHCFFGSTWRLGSRPTTVFSFPTADERP